MTTRPVPVPETCTLSTAEQPTRMAEFDALFATAVREPHRVSDTLLRLALDPSAETTARNLIARESVCCSFFTFTVAGGRAELTIDVEVPPAQTEVLDGVMARAAGRCCA